MFENNMIDDIIDKPDGFRLKEHMKIHLLLSIDYNKNEEKDEMKDDSESTEGDLR